MVKQFVILGDVLEYVSLFVPQFCFNAHFRFCVINGTESHFGYQS